MEKANSENFSLNDFFVLEGSTLEDRVSHFSNYYRASLADGSAHYGREIHSAAGKSVLVKNQHNHEIQPMWMMGSNNYLDLANSPDVIAGVKKIISEYGVGVGGPPLLNGMTKIHRELENKLSALKKKEDTLLFSSGYQANLAWTTALLRSGDHIIYDELNHASLFDGLRLARSQAKVKMQKFAHNNLFELKKKLKEARDSQTEGLIFVAVEGVYSMDGDLAPLDEISSLCRAYNALLVIDDAHGTGVMGPNGEGTATHFGIEDDVALCMGTFSKAFGVTGGFLSGSQKVIDYLRFFSRSYIFSAHLPISTVAAALVGLDCFQKNPALIQNLHKNSQYFASELKKMGYQAETSSAIIPIPIPSSVNIRALNKRFHERGVFLNSIEYPAVPLEDQRLRISMMATFTKSELDQILSVFSEVGREFSLLK